MIILSEREGGPAPAPTSPGPIPPPPVQYPLPGGSGQAGGSVGNPR